jgi:hypothetical protein
MELLNELNAEDLTSHYHNKTSDEMNEILNDFDRERSLFEKIWSLKCQLKIKCKANHISTNDQYYSMLILKFENYGEGRYNTHIDTMLNQYMNAETSNDYRCSRIGCKNKLVETSSLKFIGIPPPILIFNFARFKYDVTEEVFKKNNDRVTFNFENERFTSLYGNDQVAYYNLTGVVCHIGDSLSAGHYTAYVIEKGNWYYYSDKIRKLVEIEELSIVDYINEKAYLLFYELSTKPKNKRSKPDTFENSIENKFSQLSVSEPSKLETPEKMRRNATNYLSSLFADDVLNISFKNESIKEENYTRIDEESQEEDKEDDYENLCDKENFKTVNGIKIFFNHFPEETVSGLMCLNNILKKQIFQESQLKEAL